MDKKLIGTFLFLFLLCISNEGGFVKLGEARMCDSPSSKFKGICASDRNCRSTCETEGFADGKCKGFRRRCICSNPC